MKKISLGFSLTLFIICFGVSLAYSQTPVKTSPYTPGEVLSFDGKFSKAILRGINIADLSFTVSNAPDGKNFLVKAEAVSQGSLTKLFRFKFYQTVESTIDNGKFTVLKTVKHDEQGDRVRDSEATFDYSEKTVTYIETDPKDTARPPRKIASTIPNETYDLVSAIYIMRQLPLAVGKSFELNVSDSGLVYKIPLHVTAREQQSSILGKTWCFRLEPQVFGAGQMLEQKGSMIIWITDDNRRLPIRSQINVNIGRIDIKLRKIGK